jgi:hypothetical protein
MGAQQNIYTTLGELLVLYKSNLAAGSLFHTSITSISACIVGCRP